MTRVGAPRRPPAVLLVAHGSRRAEAGETLRAIAGMVARGGRFAGVEISFLDGAPSVATGVERCARLGARDVVVIPYFLFAGTHVLETLPALVEEAGRRHPELRLRLGEPLGAHGKLAEIVGERIDAVLGNL